MKKLLFMGWLLLSSNLFAQKAIEIKVWPNGAPNTNEMTQQVKDGPLYVEEPVLTVYPAKNGNGMAIVACPGGAYWTLAMGHEGHDMADWFNSQGITYAVLRYRMPNGHNEVPLSDSQQALRIMRQHAQEWNVKKTGYHGFFSRRASGQHHRHSFHRCGNSPGFPDSFLPGHHHGPCLHS